MARPHKLNADWFKMSAQNRSDIRMRALRNKFGAEGYGVTIMLLEALTDAVDFQIEWTALNIELYAGDFMVSSEYLKNVCKFLVDIKYLQLENGTISCQNMKESFEGLLSKREREREKNGVIVSDNPQKKVLSPPLTNREEKSREEKSREEKKKGGSAHAHKAAPHQVFSENFSFDAPTPLPEVSDLEKKHYPDGIPNREYRSAESITLMIWAKEHGPWLDTPRKQLGIESAQLAKSTITGAPGLLGELEAFAQHYGEKAKPHTQRQFRNDPIEFLRRNWYDWLQKAKKFADERQSRNTGAPGFSTPKTITYPIGAPDQVRKLLARIHPNAEWTAKQITRLAGAPNEATFQEWANNAAKAFFSGKSTNYTTSALIANLGQNLVGKK